MPPQTESDEVSIFQIDFTYSCRNLWKLRLLSFPHLQLQRVNGMQWYEEQNPKLFNLTFYFQSWEKSFVNGTSAEQSNGFSFSLLISGSVPSNTLALLVVLFTTAASASKLHGTGTNNTEWEKAHYWFLGGWILRYITLLKILKMQKQWMLIGHFLAKYGLTLFPLAGCKFCIHVFLCSTWKESYFYRNITHFPFIVIVLE